jgi:hypothetical protein
MMLNHRQAVPDRPAIHESMPPAGYPENTRLACTPGTSRTNPSFSCPGCLGPHPNWDSKPPPLSPGLSAVQGPPPRKTNPNSRPRKSRIRDKRVTSLPSPHTQVCARDNKSVTCLESMQRTVLNQPDRENGVTKL